MNWTLSAFAARKAPGGEVALLVGRWPAMRISLTILSMAVLACCCIAAS